MVTSHVKFMFDVHSEFCPVPGWKPEGPSAHEKKIPKICVFLALWSVSWGPVEAKLAGDIFEKFDADKDGFWSFEESMDCSKARKF